MNLFSAVDAHVGRHLFDKVIGSKGILSHKTRILVTHRASVLPFVDQIVVLKDGEIAECGSFEELIANKGDFAEFVAEYIIQQSESEIPEEEKDLVEQLKQQVRPFIERSISMMSERSQESDIRRRYSMRSSSISSTQLDKGTDDVLKKRKIKEAKDKKSGRLIESESAQTGSVKLEVYKIYFQMIGYTLIAYVIFSNLLSNGATIVNGLWLSEWSNDALDPKKINDTSLRDLRLGVYAGIGTFESVFTLSANLLVSLGCIRAAKLLHNKMLERILRAPMSFFGQT